jgi:hypothetical protein
LFCAGLAESFKKIESRVMLSKETILLAENWETVEDIFETQRKLRVELSKFLISLEGQLQQSGWWNKGWNFIKQSDEQIYIAHSRWRKNGDKPEYVLWIGVESFNPNALFGRQSDQQLYLWVNRDPSLTTTLRTMVAEKKVVLPGESVDRPQGYIVRKFIPKILPNEVARFGEIVSPIIIDFFTECASQEAILSRAAARNKM